MNRPENPFITQARELLEAPETAGVITCDRSAVMVPVLKLPPQAKWGEIFLRDPLRLDQWSFIKIRPRRSLGYGYRCGYNSTVNLLVIFNPPATSREAMGL